MTMKLELVPIPVTDVDRAKAFYTDQVGLRRPGRRALRGRVPGRAADPARLRLLHLHRGRDRPDTRSVQGLHLVVPDIRATGPSCSTGGSRSARSRSARTSPPSPTPTSRTPTATAGPCNSSPTETAPSCRERPSSPYRHQHASDAATRAVTWTSPATTPGRSDQAYDPLAPPWPSSSTRSSSNSSSGAGSGTPP